MSGSTKIWLHGLAAAIITGAAGAVSTALVAPSAVNLTHAGLLTALKVAAISGLIGAAGYLKQSPLPPSDASGASKAG